MFFFAIYLLLFVCLMFLSFMDKSKGNVDKYIYWGTGFVLFCLAAFKPLGIDNDSLPYVAAYYGQSAVGLDEGMETSFYVISDMIRYTIDIPEALFFVYALLSVPLTMFAIKRISPLCFPPLVMLLSKYFLVEHVTQIRASVVFALFLFAIYYLSEGKRMLYIGIILFASLFHVSALVLLPIAIFSNKPMGNKMRIAFALIPVLGYVMYFLKVDVFVASFIPYVQDKIELYEKLRDTGQFAQETNVFDKMFLLQLFLYYFLLLKYEVIQEKYRYASITLKIYSLFFASFCTLSFLPVLAGRISEFFGIIHIFLFPCVVYTFKPEWVGKALFCSIAAVFLYFSIAYMHLLNLDV